MADARASILRKAYGLPLVACAYGFQYGDPALTLFDLVTGEWRSFPSRRQPPRQVDARPTGMGETTLTVT